MSYATKAGMILRYEENSIIQLTDELNVGNIDDAKLTAALNWADGVINNALRNRYVVPFVTPDSTIVEAAEELTWYRLHSGKRTQKSLDVEFKKIMATLSSYNSGEQRLDATESPSNSVEFSSESQVFTRADLI